MRLLQEHTLIMTVKVMAFEDNEFTGEIEEFSFDITSDDFASNFLV